MISLLEGLIGGSLIGLAAVILLLGSGEIMGASNILVTFLTQHPKAIFIHASHPTSISISSGASSSPPKPIPPKSQSWKIAFFAGFFVTANILFMNSHAELEIPNFPDRRSRMLFLENPNGPFVSNLGILIAGLCTGFGTTLSNGCTTGHGICGMARFNKRSIVGALTFMGVGFITSSILSTNVSLFRNTTPMVLPNFFTQMICFSMIVILFYSVHQLMQTEGGGWIGNSDGGADEETMNESTALNSKNDNQSISSNTTINNKMKYAYALISGAVFAWGLDVSQMIDNQVVLNFLDLTGFVDGSWDPTLAYVMGSGVIVSALGYQYVDGFSNILMVEKSLQCSLSGNDFQVPKQKDVNLKLLLGATVFGFGWGCGGYCPGPATYLACVGYPQILFMYMPLYAVGAMIALMDFFQSL